MVNIELLKQVIEESGLKESVLAERSGIDYRNLYNRLRGIGEFKVSEVQGLTKTLNLTKAQREAIFFA